LDCLDSSELPAFARESSASEVAVCLKEILDRIELPPWEEIPDTLAIEAAGGPDKLTRWRIPGTRITIARVEEGPQRHEYLFSTGTVGRAVEYYEDVKSLPYRADGPAVSNGFYRYFISAPGHPILATLVDSLPEGALESIFGLAAWKWLSLFLLTILAIGLMAFAYKLQRVFADRWRNESVLMFCLTVFFPIGAMLVPMAFKYVAQHYLIVRGEPLYVLSFCANMATFLVSAVVVFAINNRIAEVLIRSPRVHPQGLDAQLIRIVTQLSSLVISLLVFLTGGQYLGIPLPTLLASTGIVGLAVALAAQDALKTIFGTLMLVLDKPFRVGERIIFDEYDGVVKDIELRSTKISLLTGHEASIPNNELAHSKIENVGRRPHIRRIADIHIPLDTSREKIKKAVEIIRTALDGHEGMEADFPPRVFFTDFKPTAFNIRIIYWYNPPSYWDFLAYSEKINLEIFRAFEEQEIQFSLPFRVAHTSIEGQEKLMYKRIAEGRSARSGHGT